MPTPHITAAVGDIAETVLLPGDPLRAKYIAEHFLEDPVQFNEVRNILGYTGTYEGVRVSVMGTGMGCPSIGIYTQELIQFYGAKNLVRIGSCGCISEELKLGDILLAIGCSTDSNYAHKYKLPGSFAATASYDLLSAAKEIADSHQMRAVVGTVLSSDTFYTETEEWKDWKKMGVMALEMESYALYCNAARAGVKALAMFTVSDSKYADRRMTVEERESGFQDMMKVALELAVRQSKE